MSRSLAHEGDVATAPTPHARERDARATEDRCERCQAWSAHVSSARLAGDCRLHPPGPDGWPMVRADDWCLGFRGRTPQTARQAARRWVERQGLPRLAPPPEVTRPLPLEATQADRVVVALMPPSEGRMHALREAYLAVAGRPVVRIPWFDSLLDRLTAGKTLLGQLGEVREVEWHGRASVVEWFHGHVPGREVVHLHPTGALDYVEAEAWYRARIAALGGEP